MIRVRSFLFHNFTIFSILVLLQSLLHLSGIVDDFNSRLVVEYFVISSLLAFTEITINRLLGRYSVFVKMLSTMAAALAEVLFLGGLLMQWFSMKPKWILLSLVLCIVITILLYFITGIFTMKRTARQINQAIRQNRKQKGKE